LCQWGDSRKIFSLFTKRRKRKDYGIKKEKEWDKRKSNTGQSRTRPSAIFQERGKMVGGGKEKGASSLEKGKKEKGKFCIKGKENIANGSRRGRDSKGGADGRNGKRRLEQVKVFLIRKRLIGVEKHRTGRKARLPGRKYVFAGRLGFTAVGNGGTEKEDITEKGRNDF